VLLILGRCAVSALSDLGMAASDKYIACLIRRLLLRGIIGLQAPAGSTAAVERLRVVQLQAALTAIRRECVKDHNQGVTRVTDNYPQHVKNQKRLRPFARTGLGRRANRGAQPHVPPKTSTSRPRCTQPDQRRPLRSVCRWCTSRAAHDELLAPPASHRAALDGSPRHRCLGWATPARPRRNHGPRWNPRGQRIRHPPSRGFAPGCTPSLPNCRFASTQRADHLGDAR
jgi:hypothetical protein